MKKYIMDWKRIGFQLDDINSLQDHESSGFIFKVDGYIDLILKPIITLFLTQTN